MIQSNAVRNVYLVFSCLKLMETNRKQSLAFDPMKPIKLFSLLFISLSFQISFLSILILFNELNTYSVCYFAQLFSIRNPNILNTQSIGCLAQTLLYYKLTPNKT